MLSTASGHRFILRAHKCIITCCTVLRRQNKWNLTIPGTFCIYSGPQFCIKSSPTPLKTELQSREGGRVSDTLALRGG
jgi:hypothetical protein